MLILEITDYKSLAILDYTKQLAAILGKQNRTKVLHWKDCLFKQAEIYHYHYSNSTYKVLLPLLFTPTRKNIVTVHDILPRNQRSRKFIAPFFYRILNHKVKHFIVHTSHAKQLLLQSFPFIKEDKITVLPYGCTPRSVDAAKVTKWRKEKKLIGVDKIFLYLGSLKKSKGIIETITAFSRITNQNAHCYFIGKINDKETQQAFDHNKDPRIHYLGALSDHEVEKWLQLTDTLVNFRLDSVGETSASVVNMLNLGKPVLASNIGSNTEVIKEAGLLCKPEVEAIQQTLERFLTDEAQHKLTRAAIKRSREVAWEKLIPDYLKLFSISI